MIPLLKKHIVRVCLSITIVILMLAHVSGILPLSAIQRLENFTYDVRLNVLMPGGVDERVVIIDIDEQSLQAEGRWPWGRDKLAHLVDQLFAHYQVNVLGFDVVFAEKDESSGLKNLQAIQKGVLAGNQAFAEALNTISASLDYDQLFANSLKDRNVVLGYFFLTDSRANATGALPTPAFVSGSFKGKSIRFTEATGYGANLTLLQQAAKRAGHFNPDTDADGITRKVPMVIQYQGQAYEALSVAVAKSALGVDQLQAGFADGMGVGKQYAGLEWLKLDHRRIPVDQHVSALIPYRGLQGSFPYVSATDVLRGKVDIKQLRNKIVLVGTTAAGLMDLRATPVQNVYAGVEIHANMIAGILDNTIKEHPAYMLGAEFVLILLVGLLLALSLPLFTPTMATVMTLATGLVVVACNVVLWQSANLVMPLASVLLMIASIYVVNMAYGFFIESRAKRQITGLFGQYVPPELVDEMAQHPESLSVESESREMTVLFSDIRGFTSMAENLAPQQLTALMNAFLSPMTHIIHDNRGTIDKYMGDAIMAFWGAPLKDHAHAKHALTAAMQMLASLDTLQKDFASRGWPVITIGIGLNTGLMTVGNMGSSFRMAYTVMGDAVNLGSRLEGLTKNYGVQLIVSEFTKAQVPEFAFRELDLVRVKGKDKPVTIYEPLGPLDEVDQQLMGVLALHREALKLYRKQHWDLAELQFLNLQKLEPMRDLYAMYIDRIAYFRQSPPPHDWDGVFNVKNK